MGLFWLRLAGLGLTLSTSTELYKEIDWITGFLPANSGQSGLTLQFNCNIKPGWPEYAG